LKYGDWTLRNKTNNIRTVYLRKRRFYIHFLWILEFGGLEVLIIKLITKSNVTSIRKKQRMVLLKDNTRLKLAINKRVWWSKDHVKKGKIKLSSKI